MSDPLANDECLVGDNEASNPQKRHQLENDIILLSHFDSGVHTVEDDFTFAAQSPITKYIGTHFYMLD